MARLVSIHAPWEGCDTSALAVVHAIDVSIHAPWEGCDACSPRRFLRQIKFQFTHPGKGATSGSVLSADSVTVSIHAPWEGCDTKPLFTYVNGI